jgi:isochorismate hydrolase
MKRISFCLMAITLVSGLRAQAPVPAAEIKEPMKPVLLVIDVQNAYLSYMSDEDKKMAFEVINGAIWLFRKNQFPVIRVYNTDPQWGPAVTSDEFQFTGLVQVSEEDSMVIKNHPSAFQNTRLEEMIRESGSNTVYITGLSAVGCALATYFGAMERDFRVFMIKDGLLSHKADYTDAVEDFTDAVGWTTLKTLLDTP